jgi:hypothetical protein
LSRACLGKIIGVKQQEIQQQRNTEKGHVLTFDALLSLALALQNVSFSTFPVFVPSLS